MPKKIRTEQLTFSIFRTNNKTWEFYKKYHYLNETIPAGHYYELKLKEKKVGFICIRKFPHPKNKTLMTIARLVIIPEFQGFGIGIKFMNEIAKLYKGQTVGIVTSLKPFILALKKNKNWKCIRFDRVSKGSVNGMMHNKTKNDSTSHNRITATFRFSE